MRKRHKLPFSKTEFLPAHWSSCCFQLAFVVVFSLKKQNKTKGRYIIFQPEASQTLLGREGPLQYTLAPLRARHLEFESTSPLPAHHTASQLSSPPQQNTILAPQMLVARGNNPWASVSFLLHPGLRPATSSGQRCSKVLINQHRKAHPFHHQESPQGTVSSPPWGLLNTHLSDPSR